MAKWLTAKLADKILVNEENTIRYKILEGENFGKNTHSKDWRIKYTKYEAPKNSAIYAKNI